MVVTDSTTCRRASSSVACRRSAVSLELELYLRGTLYPPPTWGLTTRVGREPIAAGSGRELSLVEVAREAHWLPFPIAVTVNDLAVAGQSRRLIVEDTTDPR